MLIDAAKQWMSDQEAEEIWDIVAESRILRIGVVLHGASVPHLPHAMIQLTTFRPGIQPGDSRGEYSGYVGKLSGFNRR